MPVPVDLRATVRRTLRLSPEYAVLELEAAVIAERATPGQFVMLRTTSGTDPLLRRPFSFFEILRSADGAPWGFSLLIKRVGPGSTRLVDARVGDTFECLGPLGTGFRLPSPPTDAWMVAGGVGLAPFAMLAEACQAAGVHTTLFYGGRTAADLFYLDWFAARGVSLVLATEDGTRGVHGRITAPLESALGAAEAAQPLGIFACGPHPMLKAVAALATTYHRPSQVSTEQVMGCGMGGCYSCVVKVHDGSPHGHFARSCVHGPVFDSDTIIWE